MPYTRASLAEIRAFMDAAMTREEGVLLEFDTAAAATTFIHKANMAKRIEREEAHKLLPVDPGYGISPYDQVRIKRHTPQQVLLRVERSFAALGLKKVVDMETGEVVEEDEL
jgi:hypothetical protein